MTRIVHCSIYRLFLNTRVCILLKIVSTVGLLIIELLWAKKLVSTLALEALNDPMWSKRKFARAVDFV